MRYRYIGMNRYFIYLMIVLPTLFYNGCTKKRWDGANSIVPLSDGGFAIAGHTDSKGSSDIWLLRLDGSGNIVWDKTFGGSEGDYARSIVSLSDGGFAIAGRTSSKGAGGGDMWLLRLDGSGNIVWDRTFGGSKNDYATSIVSLSDGGFAIAGYTKSKGAGDKDMWLLRLDESENIVWDTTFGGRYPDEANSIVLLSDGGFAIAGWTDSKGAGGRDMCLLRLDGSGNIIWDRTFGGSEWDGATSIVSLSDGGFAIAGYTKSKGAGSGDMWLLRLDGSGNIVWDRTFGGSEWDYASSIVSLSDGGFAIAGCTYSKGAGGLDMWLLRLDGSGNIVWDKAFGGSEQDYASSIVSLSDDGFAIAGFTRSKGVDEADMWLLRLDGSGNIVWDKTFGGSEDDDASSIVSLPDGVFAVAGSTSSRLPRSGSDGWIIIYDEEK